MLLTYHPAGDESSQVFTFKLELMRSKEVEAIEKRTGWTFGQEFREQLLKGGSLARRALLWTFLRRGHPFLKFDEVDFADHEVTLEMDAGELVDQRAAVIKLAETGAIASDDVDTALAMIDAQLAEWRSNHPDDDPADAEGKALTVS